MAKFVGSELEELTKVTDLFDTYDPIIKKKCKDPATFPKLVKIAQDFNIKNREKLLTDIMGKQILVNEKMENDIYEVFNLDKDEIKETMRNSAYFKSFGKDLALMDQLCLAVPLIFASLEYKLLNKKENSDLCYLLCFFKPYASRESVFFKYGVNEGQMQYTVEHLSDRFDLSKYGTILGVITNRAKVSYNNYIEPLNKLSKISDKDFHVIYTSGIATRMNDFLGKVVDEYRKNEGKTLEFDSAAQAVLDKDNDSTEYEDADIQSDIAVKQSVINKAIMKLTKDPVDKKLEVIACQIGFHSTSTLYVNILDNILKEVVDRMFKELPDFFNALISSFLFNINSKTGEKFTMKEFKSPMFMQIGVETLVGKKSHLKDEVTIKARTLFRKMLEEHSIDYLGFKDTYKRYMERALATYWVNLIQKV